MDSLVAAGETADIGTLLGMNFYVEGIEGDILSNLRFGWAIVLAHPNLLQ